MTSPGAIDHVLRVIRQIENEGGRGEGTCEPSMVSVWAEVLADEGYAVDVEWEHRLWGIVTHVTGAKGEGLVRVSHNPRPPPWGGVIRLGDKTLWVQGHPPRQKINTIVLVREIRPDWNITQAKECVEAQRPLLENVDEATEMRAIRYLGMTSATLSRETDA